MPKTITAGLSISSIKKAQREIRKYQDSLNKKCELFVKRLAEEGITVAKAVLQNNKSEDDYIPSTQVSFQMDEKGRIARGRIIASGNAILFLEFGTGIKYSSTVHPKASEMGYGAGTYPSDSAQQNPPYDNWESPTGWYYYGEDGKLHHTFGMAARMPMYKGAQEMREKVEKVAKEVFGYK